MIERDIMQFLTTAQNQARDPYAETSAIVQPWARVAGCRGTRNEAHLGGPLRQREGGQTVPGHDWLDQPASDQQPKIRFVRGPRRHPYASDCRGTLGQPLPDPLSRLIGGEGQARIRLAGRMSIPPARSACSVQGRSALAKKPRLPVSR
jgi:hypothetical protein